MQDGSDVIFYCPTVKGLTQMNQPSAENVERATAFLRNDLGLKAYNQDVEMLASLLDAAERRGAVEWLRSKAEEFGMENTTSATFKRILEGWANELESATKETGV
jgi:hypothetical protein